MRKTTSTESQGAVQPDSEASLRAELATQLAHAQIDLASQLSALLANSGEPALVLNLRDQLMAISALQENVATTRGTTLANLRSSVHAALGTTESLVQQIRTAVGAGTQVSNELAFAGFALRNELASAHASLFESRIFERYMSFASEAEEVAYYRSEAATRRYIEQQLALRAPEGDLNAAGATMGQMLDAHVHGAGKSPEFLPQWNRLLETTERHRVALRAEGRSTEEFDRNLTASVRRYLKEKGLTEAEIAAALAASPNPLDAVKPYLHGQSDAAVLDQSIKFGSDEVSPQSAPITAAVSMPEAANPPPPAEAGAPDIADVMSVFQAAGIKAGPQPKGGESPASQTVGKKPPATGLASPG